MLENVKNYYAQSGIYESIFVSLALGATTFIFIRVLMMQFGHLAADISLGYLQYLFPAFTFAAIFCAIGLLELKARIDGRGKALILAGILFSLAAVYAIM